MDANAVALIVMIGCSLLLLVITIRDIFREQGNPEREETTKDKPKPISKTLKNSLELLLARLKETLIRELREPVEYIGFEDTGVAIEIDLVIGGGVLEAYQELVIIPHERIKDLKYWQQITKIIINNYRARSASHVVKSPKTNQQQHSPTQENRVKRLSK